MQALAEEWKKRDEQREALVKKKVWKLVCILAEKSHYNFYSNVIKYFVTTTNKKETIGNSHSLILSMYLVTTK